MKEKNQAYEVLDQLINHDWKICLERKSGADGDVTFRGFQGCYEIRVTADGKTKQFETTIGSGGTQKQTMAISMR